ncbi:hypothetical protein STEG23_014973 [Scotinomys teguina]
MHLGLGTPQLFILCILNHEGKFIDPNVLRKRSGRKRTLGTEDHESVQVNATEAGKVAALTVLELVL